MCSSQGDSNRQAPQSIPEGLTRPPRPGSTSCAPSGQAPRAQSRGRRPETGRPGPAVGWCRSQLFPPTKCTLARLETHSPCRLRRRGMFSAEPETGPWTPLPQVLPAELPGRGGPQGCGTFCWGNLRSECTFLQPDPVGGCT